MPVNCASLLNLFQSFQLLASINLTTALAYLLYAPTPKWAVSVFLFQPAYASSASLLHKYDRNKKLWLVTLHYERGVRYIFALQRDAIQDLRKI